MPVAPYPWDSLRRASPLESALAAWADAPTTPPTVLLGARFLRVTILDRAAATTLLDDATAAAVPLRHAGTPSLALVPWRLWRALAATLLDEPPELAAPRPPTPVERALAAFLLGVQDPGSKPPTIAGEFGAAASGFARCELAVTSPIAAELTLLVPLPVPRPHRPLTDLVRARGDRLPPIAATLELARGALARRDELGALRPRDVVVVGAPAPRLRVGRGAIGVALDPAGDRLTVVTPYRRTMADSPETAAAAADPLADDLAIPLAIVVGDVAVSARRLLELAPGEVLACRARPGDAVELRAGARVIARGELVTVDGALGVRVIDVGGDALVAAAPAVLDGTSPASPRTR